MSDDYERGQSGGATRAAQNNAPRVDCSDDEGVSVSADNSCIPIPAVNADMPEIPNSLAINISGVESPGFLSTGAECAVDPAHEVNEDRTAVEVGFGNDKYTETTEDAGKEDNFLDASDDLAAYDGKNAGNSGLSDANGLQESFPGMNMEGDEKESEMGGKLDDGKRIQLLMDEVKHLKILLDEALAEKQKIAEECQEERNALKKEVFKLHMQMKDLTVQQPLFVQPDARLADQLRRLEMNVEEEQCHNYDVPLPKIMNECLELARSALAEKLESEGTIRELHAIMYMKEQDIEDLAANITENLIASDIVSCCVSATKEPWSQTLDDFIEAQLEKDRKIELLSGRMAAALSSVVGVERLFDNNIGDSMPHLEKLTLILIDKFKAVTSNSLELRQKEIDLAGKCRILEEKSEDMLVQIEKSKELAEVANAELEKAMKNLDNERDKCANAKEKLSLAVTKGKALVQQRDSLRQSLADRTVEIERISGELEAKSAALETLQIIETELKRREEQICSLHDLLSERNTSLDEFKKLILQIDMPVEFCSLGVMDRLRQVIDERSVLVEIYQEYQELKDILRLSEMPENNSSSDMKSQVIWLNDEFIKLKGENARAREVLSDHIDRLVAALSLEMLERDYLLKEMEDANFKHEGIVDKIHQISLQRDRMLRMLLNASGLMKEYSDVACMRSFPNVDELIDRCFVKINEQKVDVFDYVVAIFQRIQTALYVTAQDLALCEKTLEGDMTDRSTISNLSNELKVAYQELLVVKEEKATFLNDLQRSEEKYTMLREKLSLAVKKGKGLVQEREALKNLLDEKDMEIERLRVVSQQQQSTLNELKENINKLNTDAEHIPMLENDLVAMTNEKSLLEHILVERENTLQSLMESINCAGIPEGPVPEDPIEKIKRLVQSLNDFQFAKEHAEQELVRVREKMHVLKTELTEADTDLKLMKDRLAVHASRLAAEAKMIKSDNEASHESESLDITYCDTGTARKSVEDSLYLAEKNLSLLLDEKDKVITSSVASEADFLKAKEELAIQASKLADVGNIVKSLENIASGLRDDLACLTEEKKITESSLENFEDELRNMKNEFNVQAGQLVDAQETISSLKDALSKSEHLVFVLSNEKDNADAEILTLNSKMNSSLEDLSGTRGTLEILKNDIAGLVYACFTVIQELQSEIEKNKLETDSFHDLAAKYNHVTENLMTIERNDVTGSEYKILADKLASTARFYLDLTRELQDIRITAMKTIEELREDLYATRRKNVTNIENLQNLRSEMGAKLEVYGEKEEKIIVKEAELLSFQNNLLSKQQEIESYLLSKNEIQMLFDKLNEITISLEDPDLVEKLSSLDHLGKMLYLINSFSRLFNDIRLLQQEKEKLQSDLSRRDIQVKQLMEEAEVKARNSEQDIEKLKREFSEQTSDLEKIIQKFGSYESSSELKNMRRNELLTLLGNMCTGLILESENCRGRVNELSEKLSLCQNRNDELSAKVNLLEGSIQGEADSAEIVQERSIYEAPTVLSTVEISEINDAGAVGKNAVSAAPLAAHVRSMRKGSSDHLALNIDVESSRLLNSREVDDDKGHMFKSLNASGLVPKQVKTMADRVDGIWVSGGRVLMTSPRARLGLITYSFFLHVWLLGSLL